MSTGGSVHWCRTCCAAQLLSRSSSSCSPSMGVALLDSFSSDLPISSCAPNFEDRDYNKVNKMAPRANKITTGFSFLPPRPLILGGW